MEKSRTLQELLEAVKTGDESAAEALFSLLAEDPAEESRRSAGSTLANTAPESAIPALIRGLDHEDSFVRMVVTKRLQAFKDKLVDRSELVPKLIALLQDSEALVRYRAAAILAEMKDRTAVPFLIKMLSDPDSTARTGAADALGRIGDRSAVSSLIERLEDENDNVRSKVVMALGELGDISAIPALRKLAAEDLKSGIAGACHRVIEQLGGHKPCRIEMETLFPEAVLSVGSPTTLKGRVVDSGEGPASNVSIHFSAVGLGTDSQAGPRPSWAQDGRSTGSFP